MAGYRPLLFIGVLCACSSDAVAGIHARDTGQTPAGPPSASAPRCEDVDAHFKSELTTEGCTSPLGLCASGAIKHDRLLKGSMFVTINDMAQSAGMPASEPPWIVSVSGERSLTPHRGGTLSAHVIGVAVFNPATGLLETFNEINVITEGTGRFAGATGRLQVFGRATSPTTFVGEIHGVVCFP